MLLRVSTAPKFPPTKRLTMDNAALYFTAERAVELRPLSPPSPAADEVVVETTISAISAGTELLVYRDQTPQDIAGEKTVDTVSPEFSYPLQYGYALVGRVTETGDAVDDSWLDQRVFSFSPHQTQVVTEPESLVRIPDDIATEQAVLLPTVETAANITLDSQPQLGEQVVVFGAGVVGLTTVALLSSFPLRELVVVEPLAARRELATEFGADRAIAPDAVETAVSDADLAVELSGNPDVLNSAIGSVGYDGRVVVGSWYGSKTAPIEFGGRFHRDRIEITSSQVSSIEPTRRGRWDKDRLLSTALDRLKTIAVDQLISHRIPFESAPEAYELLDSQPEHALQVLLTYE